MCRYPLSPRPPKGTAGFMENTSTSAAARAASIAGRIDAETTSPLDADNNTIHRLLHRLVEQLTPDALAAVDSRS